MRRSSDPKIRQTMSDLSKYQKSMVCLRRLQERLDELDARLTSAGSPKLSGMPHGGDSVSMEDLVCEKVDLERRIEKLKKSNDAIRTETFDKIDTIPDATEVEIVERRYIRGQDFSEIADDMHYSARQIERLFYDGVAAVSQKEPTGDVVSMSY